MVTKIRIIDRQHVIYICIRKIELICKDLSSSRQQVRNELHFVKKNMSPKSLVQLIPKGKPPIFFKVVPPNTTKSLSIKNSESLMIYRSLNFLSAPER